MEDTPPPLPTRIRSSPRWTINGSRPALSPSSSSHTNSSLPTSRTTSVIQGIDTLKPSTRENDYVDSRKLPAAVHNSLSCKKKHNSHELADNIANEQKEFNIKPPLPPRQHRCLKPTELPPPLLPRQTLKQSLPPLHKQQPLPDDWRPSVQRPSQRARQLISASRPSNDHLQPSVIIVESSTPPPSSSSRLAAQPPPVVQQPVPSSHHQLTASLDKGKLVVNSIVCQHCGQCKCTACTQPRELPERWLCEGNCRCSADSVVDIASCMCVAKGLYYHTSHDNHGDSNAPYTDDICDCTPSPKCCLRWTGLSFLSLCLPCLCCYLPMKGGVKVAESCYNAPCVRRRGCRCER